MKNHFTQSQQRDQVSYSIKRCSTIFLKISLNTLKKGNSYQIFFPSHLGLFIKNFLPQSKFFSFKSCPPFGKGYVIRASKQKVRLRVLSLSKKGRKTWRYVHSPYRVHNTFKNNEDIYHLHFRKEKILTEYLLFVKVNPLSSRAYSFRK